MQPRFLSERVGPVLMAVLKLNALQSSSPRRGVEPAFVVGRLGRQVNAGGQWLHFLEHDEAILGGVIVLIQNRLIETLLHCLPRLVEHGLSTQQYSLPPQLRLWRRLGIVDVGTFAIRDRS